METLAPIIDYFEVKANNIVYKYSTYDPLATTSLMRKIETFNVKMQKVEHELDLEINGILTNYNNRPSDDMQSLINQLFFYREKAKLEFTKNNWY